MRWLLAGFTATWLAVCLQGDAHAQCTEDAHRAFDFWLGEWDVFAPNGQLAGVNEIRSVFGGCALHEQYRTASGFRGASYNSYDRGRNEWMQTWVDNTGVVLRLRGGLSGESMVLGGETIGPDGVATRHRITWTPAGDGSVRQHWQARQGDGDWKTAFDGRYVRRAPGGVDRLSWLAGNWQTGEVAGARRTESWSRLSSDVYQGRGARIDKEGGDVLFEESLLLAKQGGDIFYTAKVPGNALPVSFRLVEQQGAYAVFENPSHDFPTRLVYQRTDPCTLTVEVAGGDASNSLRFRRASPDCQPAIDPDEPSDEPGDEPSDEK